MWEWSVLFTSLVKLDVAVSKLGNACGSAKAVKLWIVVFQLPEAFLAIRACLTRVWKSSLEAGYLCCRCWSGQGYIYAAVMDVAWSALLCSVVGPHGAQCTLMQVPALAVLSSPEQGKCSCSSNLMYLQKMSQGGAEARAETSGHWAK